jgi:hypothetical protein
MLKGVVEHGLTHRQLRAPQILSQPAEHTNPHIESLVQISNHRRPTNNDLRDQEMLEPSEPPIRLKSETQPEASNSQQEVPHQTPSSMSESQGWKEHRHKHRRWTLIRLLVQGKETKKPSNTSGPKWK